MRSVHAFLACLAFAGLSAQVGAQQAAGRPGWIGISFDVQAIFDRNGGRSTEDIVVTDVGGGSPAARAGIRRGDILLAINDLRGAENLSRLGERLTLSVGDKVTVLIERDGRTRSFDVIASERPADLVPAPTIAWSFSPDSVVESIVRAMDSLRVRIRTDEGGTLVRVGSAGPVSSVMPATPVDPSEIGWVQAPFEFFVFRGEQFDSLRQEMDGLNGMIAQLREREASRVADLRRRGVASEQVALQDGELRNLRETLSRLTTRAADLRAAMAEDARSGASRSYGRGAAAAPVSPTEEFRPLTPYLLGRNRVAGAEVIDLRPELAAYFQVAGGVLVVDVPEGTPAAMAGLLPGDVITRIDRVTVRSVDDLRLGFSRAGDSLPLSLIRQGTSLQVLLRR